MSQKTLEARLDALETQVKKLQQEVKEKDKQIKLLNDIEAIKRLQCAYGYYLKPWMSQEIVDLFPGATIYQPPLSKALIRDRKASAATSGRGERPLPSSSTR